MRARKSVSQAEEAAKRREAKLQKRLAVQHLREVRAAEKVQKAYGRVKNRYLENRLAGVAHAEMAHAHQRSFGV